MHGLQRRQMAGAVSFRFPRSIPDVRGFKVPTDLVSPTGCPRNVPHSRSVNAHIAPLLFITPLLFLLITALVLPITIPSPPPIRTHVNLKPPTVAQKLIRQVAELVHGNAQPTHDEARFEAFICVAQVFDELHQVFPLRRGFGDTGLQRVGEGAFGARVKRVDGRVRGRGGSDLKREEGAFVRQVFEVGFDAHFQRLQRRVRVLERVEEFDERLFRGLRRPSSRVKVSAAS